MSLQALDTPQPATAAPEPAKRVRISRRMRKAIDLLATGKARTQREAADMADLNECHLSRELNKPQIRRFMLDRARETIATGVLRASNRVLELVDATSEHVSLDASKHVLAIEGIRPPDQGQVTVNANVSVGFVLDLREPGADQARSSHMSHERQIEAKPLKTNT